MDKINIEGLGRTKDDIIIDSVKPLFSAGDFFEVSCLPSGFYCVGMHIVCLDVWIFSYICNNNNFVNVKLLVQ